MQTCAMCSFVLYIHIMGNTVPDNKKHAPLQWNMEGTASDTAHTGRQKLPSVFHIMEITAPDNAIKMRSVHAPKDRYGEILSGVVCELALLRDQFSVSWGERKTVVYQLSVHMYTSFSRCCFCHFDSITVIIMEDTAPDNYTFLYKTWIKTIYSEPCHW